MKRPRPHLDRWRLWAARLLCPRTHYVSDKERQMAAIRSRENEITALLKVVRDLKQRGAGPFSGEYRVHFPCDFIFGGIAGPGQYQPERPL